MAAARVNLGAIYFVWGLLFVSFMRFCSMSLVRLLDFIVVLDSSCSSLSRALCVPCFCSFALLFGCLVVLASPSSYLGVRCLVQGFRRLVPLNGQVFAHYFRVATFSRAFSRGKIYPVDFPDLGKCTE